MFFSCITVSAIIGFAVVGVIAIFDDFRHFSAIQKSCEQYGYVQNHKVRIICHVEEPKR